MNREIKFRIYNKKQKKWIHGPGHEVNLFGEVILMGYLLDKVPLTELNDCVALQYTGLKTKEGLEIYEGDILEIIDFDGEIQIVTVVFNNGSYWGMNKDQKYQDDNFYYMDDSKKVLGNIFDPLCKPDHNGECLVCDCWLSECPLKK
jgi:YopX protein